MPTTAVATSISIEARRAMTLITTPAAAGAAKLATDCMVELMPLAFISRSSLTICGMQEFTAGI